LDSLCFDAREVLYPSSEPAKSFNDSGKPEPTPEPTPGPTPEPTPDPKPEPIPGPKDEPVKTNEPPTDETEAHSNLASALIASSGDIDRALFWLVNQGKAKAIRLAKQRGANINAVNAEGNRPLCVAVTENQEEVVKALISEGVELNYNNSTLNTPISIAAYKGFENLIRVLAQAGGDVNFTGPKEVMSSIALAARFDQVGSILTLISLNANVNSLARGTSAAHSAATWGSARALKALLDNGANPHLKDSQGRTVFAIVEKHRSDPKYDELMKVLSPYR
jgi:ankyrin repeat protein